MLFLSVLIKLLTILIMFFVIIKNNLIKKSGAFYSYGDIRLGQGRENAKTFLKANIELSNEVELLIRESSIPATNSIDQNVSTPVETD